MKEVMFDDSLFDESLLMTIDFSDWLNKIVFVLWCPSAGESWEEGRWIELTFNNLIFFGFEATLLGLSGDAPIMFNHIVLDHNSEKSRIWNERLFELSQLGNTYPDLARSAKKTEAFHFIFDSSSFEGRAHSNKGFEMMCQSFSVKDITYETDMTPPYYDTGRIPSA